MHLARRIGQYESVGGYHTYSWLTGVVSDTLGVTRTVHTDESHKLTIHKSQTYMPLPSATNTTIFVPLKQELTAE